MTAGISIAPMGPADWAEVRAIYAEGLATGLAAFRLRPPLWRDFDRVHLALGRLVARGEGGILGWAALSAIADT
jgi:phosphinothricin acetyltransferase